MTAVAAPGRAPGSMSYVVHDRLSARWVALTGDALLAGDPGRVNLPRIERAEEMAGLLHTPLFRTILPLGHGAIACLPHVFCGSGVRSITTTCPLWRRDS